MTGVGLWDGVGTPMLSSDDSSQGGCNCEATPTRYPFCSPTTRLQSMAGPLRRWVWGFEIGASTHTLRTNDSSLGGVLGKQNWNRRKLGWGTDGKKSPMEMKKTEEENGESSHWGEGELPLRRGEKYPTKGRGTEAAQALKDQRKRGNPSTLPLFAKRSSNLKKYLKIPLHHSTQALIIGSKDRSAPLGLA